MSCMSSAVHVARSAPRYIAVEEVPEGQLADVAIVWRGSILPDDWIQVRSIADAMSCEWTQACAPSMQQDRRHWACMLIAATA